MNLFFSNDIEAQKQIEVQQMMCESTEVFNRKNDITSEICKRLRMLNISTSKAEKFIRILQSESDEFDKLDIAQQTRAVFAKVLEEENKPQKTKRTAKTKLPVNDAENIVKEEDHGLSLLETTLS